MSEPLTMTAEREAEIRKSMNADYDYGPEEQKSGEGQELLAELDAEREAHKRTKEALAAESSRADENWTALERVKRKWEESAEQLRQSQEVSKALLDALKASREAMKLSGCMNGRQYVDLGIKVNSAIALLVERLDALASSEEPGADDRASQGGLG